MIGDSLPSSIDEIDARNSSQDEGCFMRPEVYQYPHLVPDTALLQSTLALRIHEI
jgi:hypothetical protein